MASAVGIASYMDMYGQLLHSIARLLDVPDPEVQVCASFYTCELPASYVDIENDTYIKCK